MADLHDSTEHYLATIFEIEEEGIEIKRARIAERLQISAPSVTEHIHRMEKQGLVKVSDDNSVSLTASGKKRATSVVRRHRLAERLLVDVIGLDWGKAHKEADRWEHVISDDVEEKLVALLDNPETCPHGNPIPNADGSQSEAAIASYKNAVALNDAHEMRSWIIRRIGERIEMNDEALEFVSLNKLIPGTSISITKKTATDIVVVLQGNKELNVPRAIGQSMYVEASS